MKPGSVARWGARALLVAAAVIGALAAALAWALWASLPRTTGMVALPALEAPVRIWRDARGVPHVFAASARDAYVALGYVHAQDRFWQMELSRLVGAGRLSEVLGEATLDLDRLVRTLGLYRRAQASVARLAPGAQEALSAYAQGVNGWLAAREGPLPPELLVLRHRPAPWTPADSLVWGRLMSLQLSSDFRDELLRGRLATRLTPEQVAQLSPPGLGAPPTTLATLLRRPGAPGLPLGVGQASNWWVVDGRHTASGAPILTNDPHLPLGAPVLWYLARLEAPGLRLAGATAPGVPFHVVGHNHHLAWGLTTTGADIQDLFVERLSQGRPGHYDTPDGPRPFTTRQETLHVRGAAPVQLQVRETRHGPVLSDMLPEARAYLEEAWGEGHVLALAWTSLAPEGTAAGALHRLHRARDWPGFVEALAHWNGVPQNVAYADVTGRIGVYVPGRIPRRGEGEGRMPRPGWEPGASWEGMIPHGALPHRVDPPDGRLVNANNAVVGPDYPHHIAADYEEPYRARRIEEMLDAGQGRTLAGHEAMLMDAVSLAARDLLPVMLAALPEPPPAPEAVARLRAWDGTMRRDRPEPLVFTAWLRALRDGLFGDEAGPLLDGFLGLMPVQVRGALAGQGDWCDDQATPARESCRDIAARALEDALAELRAEHGDDPARWRWGDAHRAPLAHRLWSRVPVLRHWLDIGVATDGGWYTVNRGAHETAPEDAPYTHTHGPGYRAVYDLADLSRSRFHIATGQSGHPLSPHYDDFVADWVEGRFVTLRGSEAQLEAAGARLLRLVPGD